MRDPTAQTEPLTIGQQIVTAWESDIIAEPCELASAIDQAIASEREACAKIVECAEGCWPYPPAKLDIAKAIRDRKE